MLDQDLPGLAAHRISEDGNASRLGDSESSFAAGTVGLVKTRWKGAGLVVSETLHRADRHLPAHSHCNASLSLVMEGAMRERIDNRTFEGGPGTMIFKPADEQHENWYGPRPVQTLLIEVARGNEIDPHLAGFRSREPRMAATARGAQAAGALLLRELRTPIVGGDLIIESLAMAVVGMFRSAPTQATPGGTAPGWLRAVRDRLHDEPQRARSISDHAGDAGVHPASLCRAFRRHFGMSIGHYVRRQRLDQASTLLRTTRVPVSSIAHRCGFADHAQLCRSFQREFGVTPTAWRRMVRGA